MVGGRQKRLCDGPRLALLKKTEELKRYLKKSYDYAKTLKPKIKAASRQRLEKRRGPDRHGH